MRNLRHSMVQNGPFKFYAKVTNKDNEEYYFSGTYGSSKDFKESIRAWYAENVDPVEAYNIIFSKITNVGKIDGPDESDFINV